MDPQCIDYSSSAMMQDPELFPDPDVFRPERFLPGEDGTIDARFRDFTLPFGFGRRQCPGMHVVSQSLYVLIARYGFSPFFRMHFLTSKNFADSFGHLMSFRHPIHQCPIPRRTSTMPSSEGLPRFDLRCILGVLVHLKSSSLRRRKQIFG